MQRSLFRVSCKAAIYDPTFTYVLIANYTPTKNGLPGGHLEEGEIPDQAMRRELTEEIGFEPEDLLRKDFWIHDNGKVILGYTATSKMDQEFDVDYVELRSLDWIPIDEIRAGKVPLGTYASLVLDNAK